MPSIGIGYGNFSSNRRLQQVFAGQSVSSRPPRHSEQLSLYFSQTLCGTFSNGILRPRISQHHGRVNIVHAVPLRRRCRTAPYSVTIRATVRAASVHPDIDTLRTVAYAALAAIFPGGERIAPSAAPPIPCLYNNRFGCQNAANPLWMYRFRVRCRTSQPYPRKQRPDVPYPPETEPLPQPHP